MRTRQLGNSDIDITPIGMGPGPLRLMTHAHDSGVNWVDPGPNNPAAEEEVGAFLQSLGEGGRPYVFATGDGGSSEGLRRAVDDSLRRLRVEVIDLYQVQAPTAGNVDGAMVVLKELQAAGKIRHLGAIDFSVAQLQQASTIVPIVSVQARVLSQTGMSDADLLAYCQHTGIGMINRPPKTDNKTLLAALETIAEEHHVAPTAVAIAWTLRHASVTGALVGGEAPEDVDAWMDAVRMKLSVLDVARLEECLLK